MYKDQDMYKNNPVKVSAYSNMLVMFKCIQTVCMTMTEFIFEIILLIFPKR